MNYYLFDSLFCFRESTLVDILTLIVLSATLIFVFIYTRSTIKIQETSEKQSDLSLLPSIMFGIHLNDRVDNPDDIRLQNVGMSPAVNVWIEPIQFKVSGICGLRKIIFPKVSHLLNDGIPFVYKNIKGINLTNEDQPEEIPKILHEGTLKDLLKILMKNSDYNTFDVVITFQDIIGNRYKQVNKFINGEYHHGIVKRGKNILDTGPSAINPLKP